jgi:hypothetical protein
VADTLPELLAAVSVYVVVALGVTETEPLLPETEPGAGWMLSVVAPEVLHDNEVD